ncbi:MAG TPA: N-acetyltransferase [Fimbriimonadaceae bacterium]|jgi:ribosomal protein S18 acetylase RimI-like enzyme
MLQIRLAESQDELISCANSMALTEPWITLRVKKEACLRGLKNPAVEVHVATLEGEVVGFATINMNVGPFRGYIQTLHVFDRFQGRGFGTALIEAACTRILKDSPNVFMMVSDFNARAQSLYYRLGFQKVGEFENFVVKGHSEFLLRKTTGPFY